MKINNKDYFLLYRLKHFHLCANGRQGKIVHKASQNIPYLDIKSHSVYCLFWKSAVLIGGVLKLIFIEALFPFSS